MTCRFQGLRLTSEKHLVKPLTELLTDYGPIDLLWFDQYNNLENRKYWPDIIKHVKSIQPNCLVIANNCDDDQKTDIHGYEYGWRVARKIKPMPDEGNTIPSEVCDNIGNGWFWHTKAAAAKMNSAEEVVRMLELCNSRSANYLLNVAPDNSGRIPEWGVKRLHEIGKLRKAKESAN